MIEPIMFVGIGFLVAGLLVIGVIPLVHSRAVRLTMRRLEALTPLSMAEIQADKDQLRAEFAMSTRRLEMSVEQMKAKTTNQLAETGKTSEADMFGRQLVEERAKTEQHANRGGELDRQILAQSTEAEVLNRRVQELTTRLDEQGRFLADREFVSDQLRNEAASAQKTEA